MKKKNGFTLVELSISVGFIGIILVISSILMNYSIAKFHQGNQYFKDKNEIMYALSTITDIVKKNNSVTFENGKIKASDSSVLINTNKNDFTGYINFYYDANRYGLNDGYGEIRNTNGDVVVKNVKEFIIESINPSMLKVTLKIGEEKNNKVFDAVQYIGIY